MSNALFDEKLEEVHSLTLFCYHYSTFLLFFFIFGQWKGFSCDNDIYKLGHILLSNFSQWHFCITIDHFTAAVLVSWPLSGSEAAVDLVMIQTLELFRCKFS